MHRSFDAAQRNGIYTDTVLDILDRECARHRMQTAPDHNWKGRRHTSNRLVDIEELSERELDTLHTHYRRLAALSKAQNDLFSSHSVDEAERRHRIKAVEVEKAG